MRVLAGGPAREVESPVFRLHEESLRRQEGFEVTVRHMEVPPLPEQVAVRWPFRAIERVARARQQFLEMAEPYDALLMVDTDVVLGPSVLRAMWEVEAPVVYGVFWTVWPGWDMPMPQVWDVHPYGHTKECIESVVNNRVTEVMGGGACTLFRGRAFESRYWPLMMGLVRAQGGMWAGEDRHYCIGCEARGIRQVAVSKLPIVHLYTEEQQTEEALAQTRHLLGL